MSVNLDPEGGAAPAGSPGSGPAPPETGDGDDHPTPAERVVETVRDFGPDVAVGVAVSVTAVVVLGLAGVKD